MDAPVESIERRLLRGREVETFAVRLPDGRRLSFCDLGPRDAPTLFYLHGTGSCRYEALTGIDVASEAGVRVIAPDRPGFGRSDPDPGRSIASIAADLANLATALGIARFAVAGLSGGGPHALAAALHLPGRVIAGAALNTAGERRGPLWRSASLGVRLAVAPAVSPWVARNFVLPKVAKGASAALMSNPKLTSQERAEIAADPDYLDALFAEGLRQGPDAFLHELRLFYHQPWDLDWGALQRPFTILQGREDLMLFFVRAVAAAYPDKVTLVEIPGGHLSGGTPEVWRRLLALPQDA